MSATERRPELVHEERRRELELATTQAREQLAGLHDQVARLRRRIRRGQRRDRRATTWSLLAGVAGMVAFWVTWVVTALLLPGGR